MKRLLALLPLLLCVACDDSQADSSAAVWELHFNAYTITEVRSGNQWWFNFPDGVNSPYHIGYVTSYQPQDLLQRRQIVMEFSVEGDGPFRCDTGDTPHEEPAYVRLYVSHAPTMDWHNEFHRWWSNPVSYKLSAGRAVLNAPIDGSEWTSVYGKRGSDYPAEFDECFRNAGWVGMTFGGGGSFGHGAYVPVCCSRFELLDYRIE